MNAFSSLFVVVRAVLKLQQSIVKNTTEKSRIHYFQNHLIHTRSYSYTTTKDSRAYFYVLFDIRLCDISHVR